MWSEERARGVIGKGERRVEGKLGRRDAGRAGLSFSCARSGVDRCAARSCQEPETISDGAFRSGSAATESSPGREPRVTRGVSSLRVLFEPCKGGTAPWERVSVPCVRIVDLDSVAFAYLTKFVHEPDDQVVFTLALNVRDDARGHGLTDRERRVAVLPCERCVSLLVHPSRGVRLQIARE